MRAVLADTGPLYALVDRDDAMHLRARTEVGRLRDDNRTVLVAQPTLCEAHALVLRRLGSEVARRWLAEIRNTVGLVNPTSEQYASAVRRLGEFPDQPITLFDAVAGEVAAYLETPVWTYDHHFDAMQASVWR